MGDDSKQRSQARIIAATNRDLRKMVAEGSFRTDLYYRLDIHQVDIPPLRERKGDLPLLLPQLISKAAEENGKATPTTPPALLSLLQGHDWPGNVRELDKLCLDAVARHPGGVLSTQSFRDKIGNRPAAGDIEDHIASAAITFPDPLPTIDQATEALIDEALRRVDGNQTIAAPMLGLSRAALNVRLARRKKDRQSSNKD
jgi:DNA-binding NtrC family response regulator